MQASFNLVQVMCGALLLLHPARAKSIVNYLQAKVSSEWNEDLEPVIESITGRIQKMLLSTGADIVYDETLSFECLRSLVRIATGLRDRKVWALKFLDSNGAFTINKIDGSVASIGGYDECLSIRVPQIDQTNKLDFAGKYCSVSVHVDRQPMLYRLLPEIAVQEPILLEFLGSPNATWALEMMERLPLGMRVGICLPSKCEDSIVTHLVQKFGGKYGIRAKPLACRDDVTAEPFHAGIWIAGFVFLIAIILVVWGTIDFSVRLMRCFSVRVSYLKLTASEVMEGNRDVDCIHGIRVLSSLWILLSHTFLGDPALYDRGLHFLVVLRSPVFSIVTQGILAVDSFFALTGILVYRKLYQGITKDRILEKVPVVQFVSVMILRRALRLLVPALAVICMLYFLPVVTSGPGMDAFYPFFRRNCDQRWWTQLFFINNWWSFELACMGNQWYIAADMQLLIILILPTVLMVYRPYQGVFVLGLLIVFSNAYTAFLTIYYDATPTYLILPRQALKVMQFALRISDQALPYLATVCIGILGGHYIEHYKNREISPMVTKICWSLIGLVSFIIVFVVNVWHRRGSVSQIEAVLYGSLYRPLWGACVVWVVFFCASGKAPFVRWILNRPNVMILSRLSYCFYLCQYIVIMLKNFTGRYMVAFTYYQNFRDFFADAIFNYLLAVFIFFIFEAPTYALDKLAFAKQEARSGRAQINDQKDIKYVNQVFDTPNGSVLKASSRAALESTHDIPFALIYRL
ncbi:nose resistant to fluoxetine protein 6-like isoform X3 [Varroa jacobsoni]|uniref:nose resistant to fluoxetine protein 6-like isoform X3 n=1 Tax=Varroa jacobsoni TaxID=62625 RepID=UPI000BF3AA3C|nr:nose resistant to fluoxetine protein 6-like isoform X3 [Varroa jacobsoni]